MNKKTDQTPPVESRFQLLQNSCSKSLLKANTR